MANEPSKPQSIPLAKIHDLPGVFIPKLPDKSYGGLVTSIQASGVKEAVTLRLREDGEYQLVDGYRRRRACELAKIKEIPANVYEMTLQEAVEYHKRVQNQPTLPIPGKRLSEQIPKVEQPVPKDNKVPTGTEKPEQPTAADKKAGEQVPKVEQPIPKDGKAPAGTEKPEQPAADKKAGEQAPKIEQPIPKDGKGPAGAEKPEQPTADKKAGEQAPKVEQPISKDGKGPAGVEKPEQPAAADKKSGEQAPKVEQSVPKDDKAPVGTEKPEQPAAADKKADERAPKVEQSAPKDGKDPAGVEKPEHSASAVKVSGPAAKGPAGTQITQVFEDRLAPPDEKALKNLPSPNEGESYFIILHPGYLEKSKYNTITVDQNSEDYRELKKSIELNGVKDPVLTRINPEGGGLEIVSGQRRHMIARELNYPVPAIIQKLSDADVKILVNDGNLHRPHISTYDLARALRGKMEGMKQKAGRKKKGAPTAEELNSDEKLAQEMGMSVSKLNRIIRLSEASKEVCDRVDDGTLPLSVASAISFLKQENQDKLLNLSDLGYKVSTERVEYLKKVEKAGKLDETAMRNVLEGENILEPVKAAPPPGHEHHAAPGPGGTAPVSNPAAPYSGEGTHTPETTAGTPADKPTWEKPVETPTTITPSDEKQEIPPAPPKPKQETESISGAQERPEYTKVVLAGDRLRRYFPDVTMTPREIEESVYEALEERRQRLEKQKQKETIFKKNGPAR